MHRSITPEGAEFIKSFEGFMPKAYSCAGGFKTIGYGHRLGRYEDIGVITKEEAEELFSKDIIKSERAVLRNIYVFLYEHEFDALVSFTFNLGGAALQRSSLRQKLNTHRREEAAEEFNKWILSKGRRLSSLIKRRQAESRLFSYGIYSHL